MGLPKKIVRGATLRLEFVRCGRCPKEHGPYWYAYWKDYRGVTGDITMDDKRNATKPAVVLSVGKGGKYEFSGRIQPEGMKESTPAEAPRANPDQPKKTEGNTAPNPAPGTTPTPTPAPAPGATTSAQNAATTGQRQGVPAGEHPKK